MIDGLIEYTFFVLKAATVLLILGVGLVVLIRSRRSHHPFAARLEVQDLNERYRGLARSLERASLSKRALRALRKEDRKALRRRAEAQTRQRLFVIDFVGDIKASEVGALREIVSAVLLAAGDSDEVLVRVENAGGMVTEHGLAASQLARLRARKIPLTVAVDKVAASGGYLMACVADRIIAAPFAIVGSIGVVAQLPNFHRWLDRHGIDFELHTAGEHKRTVTVFGENTDEGRAKLREQIEDVHALFKAFIAENRPQVDLDRVATGEYWHATQALDLGLIDAVTTSDDYLLSKREQADILQVSYAVYKRPVERLVSSVEQALSRLSLGLR